MQKLQFIENVNYLPAGEQENIDLELQELRELLEAGFGDYELYLQLPQAFVSYHESIL